MGTYSPNPAPNRPKAVPPRGKLTPTQGIRLKNSPPIAPVQPSGTAASRLWGWLGAIALLLGFGAGTVGLGWLSLQLIVNPQSVRWVNQWIPGWTLEPSTTADTQTLAEIRADLGRRGQRAGELLTLGQNVSIVDSKTSATDVLLPVVQSAANCFSDCDRLVELRVYQSAPQPVQALATQTQYYLVAQLPLTGVEESFAIAPLVDATAPNQGSSRLLPLTQLSRYEGTVPRQGIWLTVSGNRTRGDEAIAYGQILYYHPSHQHLSVKLTWTSPTAETPVWKEVTGGHFPELIINHTVGMEPQFDIYQVKAQPFRHSPVQLEHIALTPAALPDAHYESALLLARHRLWSTSLTWLQAFKARSPQRWTASAQAQLAVIQWHAQATQTQAEGSWASPGQQILANLLDGRWERATTVFTASLEASQEARGILKGDRERLENRVHAILRVNPSKFDGKVWGALLIAAQKTPQAAIAWLQQQPKTNPQERARIQTLIQRLDPSFTDLPPQQPAPPKPSPPNTSAENLPPSAIAAPLPPPQ
ncbi:MAG: hypothetical protein NW220_00610 [Leptolyngbyaceae cyanobacterium bins.349]|nr:hypothetical protein [Leptolyngbyaceae cyanobacterium bins.349]